MISLVDDAEQWPGAQESSQAAPAQDDPGAKRARVPLARLQQRLYGFQQPVVQTSPVLSAGCKAGFAAQPAVLRVHLAPEKSDTLSMVNNFLFYSHARLLAEQVGWGFEALVRNTTFGKGRMSWAPYFPGAPLRLHGRSASRQRQGVVVWAIRDGEDPRDEVDARCPLAEIHDCQLAARVRAAGCARMDVQPPGDWGMDRFVPFKAQLQRWFAPKAPAHLPPPSTSDVVIHLRKCWMYKKSRSSGVATPLTAADMRSRNYFCKLNFMTDPPLGFFDRVIADIKSRREVKRVWVVTGHRQGHRNCLEHAIPYLKEKWGAELFTAGENAIDDWVFLRRATGPVILTSGSFGTMAAWLGAASEIHMPVAGTNKKRVLWSDARVRVHDIEDEKYFGAYSNALGRFVFREGRAVARNNTDCYQLHPTRRHRKGEKRGPTSGRDPAGTFVGSTGSLSCTAEAAVPSSPVAAAAAAAAAAATAAGRWWPAGRDLSCYEGQ